MTTAAKTNPTPELILVTDFFREHGYASNPPSSPYLRVNSRLNNGTFPCLRVSKYKRYITAETARQILAEIPATLTTAADEPEAVTETPALALVTDEPTATTPDEPNLATTDVTDLRRGIALLTIKITELTDTVSELNQRLNTRRK